MDRWSEWPDRPRAQRTAIIAQLMAKLGHLGRPCWLPVVKAGDGPAVGSKFGGAAWLQAGETWPICPNCEQPMQLFLQLVLETLRDELQDDFGQGLVQLFYCTTQEPQCWDECEAYLPHARSTLSRRVDPGEGGSASVLDDTREAFAPRRIVGWAKVAADLPSFEEHGDIKLTEDEDEAWEALELPTPGDKLAGWPAWSQGVEYPACRDCGRTMRQLFQLGSEDHLPHSFGRGGVAHLMQCPDHQDELAFVWRD